MRLADRHCHLQDKRFAEDRDAVLRQTLETLQWALVVGDTVASSREAAALAEAHDRLYAAAGIHPHNASTANEATLSEIETLNGLPQVVAWGEIGLDYHYDLSPRPAQRETFHYQLDRACRMGKPVVIHTREAEADTLSILREFREDLRGVLHCFSGSVALAEAALDLGLYISFSGIATFPKAQEIRDAAAIVPLDRLMVETDSPYLAPQPVRGKRCEPVHVLHTAETLARLRGIPLETLAETATANAERLFGITPPPTP